MTLAKGLKRVNAGPTQSFMQLTDFDYALPDALIAQTPLADRSASRLLVVEEDIDRHQRFVDLVGELRPDDVLVVNDTRVLKARLAAQKDTGGAAEVLLERIESDRVALCQVRVSNCRLYTSPSPRDATLSRMPSST